MPYVKNTKPEKKRQINKESRYQIYRSSRWKKLRLAKLMEQPLCEICLLNGVMSPAADVNHTDSFMNYEGTNRSKKDYYYNNLLSVCKKCHSYLHRNGTSHG